MGYGYGYSHYGYDHGIHAGAQAYGGTCHYQCPPKHGHSFVLIVVLFILLIIVGAAYVR